MRETYEDAIRAVIVRGLRVVAEKIENETIAPSCYGVEELELMDVLKNAQFKDNAWFESEEPTHPIPAQTAVPSIEVSQKQLEQILAIIRDRTLR